VVAVPLQIVTVQNVGNATRWMTGWPGTAEARLLFRPGERSIRGRSAIEAFYVTRQTDERRRTRHLWSNLFVRPAGPRQAHADVVLTNYAFEPAVSETALQMRIGNVVCRCESDEAGCWRFVEHLYERIFASSLPLAGGVMETPRT